MAQRKGDVTLKTQAKKMLMKKCFIKGNKKIVQSICLAILRKRRNHKERTIWGEREVVKDKLPENEKYKIRNEGYIGSSREPS